MHIDGHNILVISDLHLGEDLKPTSREGMVHMVLLERELEAFLDHYASHRRDERPWRLIVNGDMVDFLSVCLMPHEADLVTGLHEDDHTWGIGTRASAAAVKMQRVLDRHDGVFRALARFLGAGNALSIVVGNHDAEFHWPEVQAILRDRLGALWSEERADDGPTVEEIDAAVSFHPWFFFEEGVVWVEHGHQYDGYCSFDTILDPVDPTEEEFELNVGSAAMRYLGNHFSPNGAEQADLGFFEYLSWAFRNGDKGLRALGGYAIMTRRLLTQWRARMSRPKAFESRRRRHLERIKALARRARLPEEKLIALYRLHKPPAFTEVGRLARAIMLDRLLVALLALALVPLLVMTLPWSWSPAGLVLIFALVALADQVSSRYREKVDPSEAMRRISQKIRKVVRAPIVVFGHSHMPVAERTTDGWYFNTGTWVAGSHSGLLRSFTHLMIERGERGTKAALCQWRNGRSVAFRPAPRET